ncbi:hypothetical protein UCDDS831_g08093 [Diplodia seriata]|uniref:Uncharacterized protein n=1 Tax=Diplodia seriata TaxID=420778 RepID=A0A0G2DVL4_9PEZI|nr:hypothetical protein UCDDS831_g08093 [Diplodia seriata]
MGDVAELSESTAKQLEELSTAQLLTERILSNFSPTSSDEPVADLTPSLAIGRSLLGSNRYLDVVTYRLPNHEQPNDYMAELIEHTGPREAITVLRTHYDKRSGALWLLLDRAERELNITMTLAHTENGVNVINTRRLGRPAY